MADVMATTRSADLDAALAQGASRDALLALFDGDTAKLDAAPKSAGLDLATSPLGQLLDGKSPLDALLGGPHGIEVLRAPAGQAGLQSGASINLNAAATPGTVGAATAPGNPVGEFVRASVDNLVKGVTLDPHHQIEQLASNGDRAIVGVNGQIKGGVGVKGFAVGGGQAQYGNEVTVTQIGGPRAPGDTRPADPISYRVISENKLSGAGYAEGKASAGGVGGKATADAGASAADARIYSFATKADAERGIAILQRLNAETFAGVANDPGPGLDRSVTPTDTSNPLGRLIGIDTPNAADMKFLQDHVAGTSQAVSFAGRPGGEAKYEGGFPVPLPGFDKLGLKPPAGSVAGSVRANEETRIARSFNAETSGKPATVTYVATQELSGTNQLKLGIKAGAPGLPGNTSLGNAPSVRVEDGKTVLTTTVTYRLTPGQAAEYARVQGGNSIDDARILGGKFGQPDTIAYQNVTQTRTSPPLPGGDGAGDVVATYSTTTVVTTIDKPNLGDGSLARPAFEAYRGNAQFFRDTPNLAATTRVTTTDFVRHGGEYQNEAAVEAKGSGKILPFEFKPSLTERRITDTIVGSTTEIIGAPVTVAKGEKPLNLGVTPKARQDVEDQLNGIGPQRTTVTTAAGVTTTSFDARAQQSSGTSIWALSNVAEGRNHGHDALRLANEVNAVLRDAGQLAPGASIATESEARTRLADAYAAATPDGKAAIVERLRNDIGVNFGLDALAAANPAPRADAASYQERFTRPQVQG